VSVTTLTTNAHNQHVSMRNPLSQTCVTICDNNLQKQKNKPQCHCLVYIILTSNYIQQTIAGCRCKTIGVTGLGLPMSTSSSVVEEETLDDRAIGGHMSGFCYCSCHAGSYHRRRLH
jgi:hypothetical protein